MVFKLFNIDGGSPSKTKLEPGTHIFGRGKLLNVNDKRISRQHGQFEVTDDSLVVTALHQNPCFFQKQGTDDVQTLTKNSSVNLSSGDKLGLFPTSNWYEVLQCMPMKGEENNRTENECQENIKHIVDSEGETDNELTVDPVKNVVPENYNSVCQLTQVMTPCKLDKESSSNNVHVGKENTDSKNISTVKETIADSQPAGFLLNETHDDGPLFASLSPSRPEKKEKLNEAEPSAPGQSSAQKRPNSGSEDEQSDEPKKIKTELEVNPDVIPEVKTNPDSQQGSSSLNINVGANAAAPAAARPLRERCMYGANCYRRNPAHRAQFSHPQDADWGTGQKAPCPWGAACAKRDPRHWRDHDHLPGKDQPPPQAGVRVVHRQGNVFYINAHSVNFYDGHFALEDSDGDSVYYDYKFRSL